MNDKFDGTLKMIGEKQTISEKFSKREFVVSSLDDKYPQLISFQLVNDKCDLVNNLKIGDAVAVSYNLRGREWTSPGGEVKYFNTLEAWSISLTNLKPISNEVDDDLPF
jgi:hypothetical protein